VVQLRVPCAHAASGLRRQAGEHCRCRNVRPRPGPDEVLVRVFASPINPSDLMFVQGLYGLKKPLPAVPGFEGGGTVVQAGTGMLPRASSMTGV
jgi:NADPH:quinone reductase-like Zn-dependent oxidoreductase